MRQNDLLALFIKIWLFTIPGNIFWGDSERFAHFSAKNLTETGLMGEKSQQNVIKQRILLKFLAKYS